MEEILCSWCFIIHTFYTLTEINLMSVSYVSQNWRLVSHITYFFCVHGWVIGVNWRLCFQLSCNISVSNIVTVGWKYTLRHWSATSGDLRTEWQPSSWRTKQCNSRWVDRLKPRRLDSLAVFGMYCTLWQWAIFINVWVYPQKKTQRIQPT